MCTYDDGCCDVSTSMEGDIRWFYVFAPLECLFFYFQASTPMFWLTKILATNEGFFQNSLYVFIFTYLCYLIRFKLCEMLSAYIILKNDIWENQYNWTHNTLHSDYHHKYNYLDIFYSCLCCMLFTPDILRYILDVHCLLFI